MAWSQIKGQLFEKAGAGDEGSKELVNTYKKETPGQDIDEKLTVPMGIEAWIRDFLKSDAPQFKGKSKDEKIKMAVAAYQKAEDDFKKESVREAYKGNQKDFSYDVELAIDNMGFNTKSIKKVSKKGKGYEVRLSSYMDKDAHEKIADKTGTKLVDFQKTSGMTIGIYEGFNPKQIKMAIGVATDKRYKGGNMTGAVKAIEKIAKGLSSHPQVAAVLKRVNEAVKPGDEGEYDQEGGMAKTQLRGILTDAGHMIEMFEDDQNLPEWVQNKITKAADYLNSAHRYMMNKDDNNE